MFKAILATILLGISSLGFASDTITLSKKNTIVFRGVVDEKSVTQAEATLMHLNNTLPKGEPVYLYLETPGGSIDAGLQFIRYANSLDREVKTITSFAASMGFVMVENLGERLVLDGGILMSHRAKIGLEGQIPGEFNTRSNFYMKLITQEETQTAARVGLNLKDYRNLIHDEYWVNGQDAVDQNMADRVVDVKCGKDMQGSHKETLQIFIFSIDVVFSDCPLISGPLEVVKPKDDLKKLYPVEAAKAEEVIDALFYSPSAFVEHYIINDEYKRIFQ